MDDRQKTSHDILNLLERLRIMHDLAKDGKYESIPQQELKKDLLDSLKELEKIFKEFIQ